MFQINSKEVLSGRDLAANPLTMKFSNLMLIGFLQNKIQFLKRVVGTLFVNFEKTLLLTLYLYA
jgi:hypothetical protein